MRRYLLISFLSLFLLNPCARAAKGGVGKERPKEFIRFKADLLSQRQRKDTSLPMTQSGKIGPGLDRYILHTASARTPSTSPSTPDTRSHMDRIILEMSEGVDLDSEILNRYCGSILKKRGNLIAVEIPAEEIGDMVNNVEGIRHARLPLKFSPADETSEGVSITGAASYHTAGYTGAGIRVAIIDVGFKGLSEAQENGDIPLDVTTNDFTGIGLETEYLHGTACAEIVYDMAPDAELYLLKVHDEIDIYDALDYCSDNKIDIISISLSTFGSGPGDGTGDLDQAFDDARAAGMLVVAAAGNYATYNMNGLSYGAHWEGPFSDLDLDNYHEFEAGDPESDYNAIAAFPDWDDDGNPETDEVTIVMRWNDDWTNASVDYDMFLFDYETAELVDYSNAIQDGSHSQPPMEIIVIDLPDSEDYPHYYALVVAKKTGEPAGKELEIYLGGTSMFVPIYPSYSAIATPSGSIGEPADAEGVLTVGAIDYMDWATGPQESFSSQGPTNAWAGSNARIKPDICGPDDITSFTYSSYENSSFSGTSAAAPHISGAAALILSRYPALSPDQLQSYIESGGIDMGQSGKDNIFGSGKLNMAIISNSPASSTGGGGGGGGCFIATAAFGSPLDPHVELLRQIRDRFLISNQLGRSFITLYYRYSPPVAAFIARHDRIRATVRLGLVPIVWISWLVLRFGLLKLAALFLLLAALAGIRTAAFLIRRGTILRLQ